MSEEDKWVGRRAIAQLIRALLGGQLTPNDIRAQLPWSKPVLLPESDDQIAEISETLATTRAVLSSSPQPRDHALTLDIRADGSQVGGNPTVFRPIAARSQQ